MCCDGLKLTGECDLGWRLFWNFWSRAACSERKKKTFELVPLLENLILFFFHHPSFCFIFLMFHINKMTLTCYNCGFVRLSTVLSVNLLNFFCKSVCCDGLKLTGECDLGLCRFGNFWSRAACWRKKKLTHCFLENLILFFFHRQSICFIFLMFPFKQNTHTPTYTQKNCLFHSLSIYIYIFF